MSASTTPPTATNATAPRLSDELTIIFGFIFCTFTIMGTLGNVLIIVAVSTDRKMRSSNMNLLLSTLAVADLGNLLTCIAEWGQVLIHRGPAWLLPLPVLCPTLRFAEILCLYTSLLTQIVICIERFIVIVHPIHARHLCTRTKIMWSAGCAWLFAALCASPYAVYHELHGDGCHMTLPQKLPTVWAVFKWAECLLFYFIPLAIMVALYTRVILALSRKDKMLQENMKDDNKMTATRRAAAIRLRFGVVRMLVACVLVYFLFYSPIQAIFIAKAVFDYDIRPQNYAVALTLNALAIACSACNPLLYTLFSTRFRVKFAQMLCCVRGALANRGPSTTYGVVVSDTGTTRTSVGNIRSALGNANQQLVERSAALCRGGYRASDGAVAPATGGANISMRRKITIKLQQQQHEIDNVVTWSCYDEDGSTFSGSQRSSLAIPDEARYSGGRRATSTCPISVIVNESLATPTDSVMYRSKTEELVKL